MQKKDTSNLLRYLANKKNFSRVLQEKYRATIATAVNMQKYPFYKSFLTKIIIFLEAEGAARPKTSFFLKRRDPLHLQRSFLIKRQAPPVIASDQRERGNPDSFSSGVVRPLLHQ
ncbi:MAG: hypothetical protein ACFNWZ_00595 [Candidatus Absconditicoccaceae bacterium]